MPEVKANASFNFPQDLAFASAHKNSSLNDSILNESSQENFRRKVPEETPTADSFILIDTG